MIKIHGNDMILPSLFSAPGRVGPVQQALQHLRQELPERPRRQHRDIPERESNPGIAYLISFADTDKIFYYFLRGHPTKRRLSDLFFFPFHFHCHLFSRRSTGG